MLCSVLLAQKLYPNCNVLTGSCHLIVFLWGMTPFPIFLLVTWQQSNKGQNGIKITCLSFREKRFPSHHSHNHMKIIYDSHCALNVYKLYCTKCNKICDSHCHFVPLSLLSVFLFSHTLTLTQYLYLSIFCSLCLSLSPAF